MLTVAATIAACLLTAGCTHNDGDIGPMFGTWRLTRVTATGCDAPQVEHPLFWQFQSSVIRQVYENVKPEGTVTFGNWRIADNTLFISYQDGYDPASSPLGLPQQSQLQLLRSTGSTLTVSYSPVPEGTVTYHFTKW